jgi:ferredoxin--NADP+ reductase
LVDAGDRQAGPTSDELRHRYYNARVARIRLVHDDLMILRVVPDVKCRAMRAGQYTLLGLGRWERRADRVMSGSHSCPGTKGLIRRAYSISCPLLDDSGALVTIDDLPYLEFFINCIRKAADEPPMLTPRLFALNEGDRLYIGPHAHGHYTVEAISGGDNVIFAATGTGESPHNAMLAELLRRRHEGKIVVVTCVRYRADLAYLDVHSALERRFANYRYLPLTTRESENVDPSHSGYVGKQYLQDLFASECVARKLGFQLDPLRTHVYLCGSPAMIGPPRRTADGDIHFPEPVGMVEVLSDLGFHLDEPHRPGNVHFEKYW